MRTRLRLASRILVVATATAVAATLAIAAPVQANEPARVELANRGVQSHELNGAIDLLEPYVSRSTPDGTFSLSAPQRTVKSIDPDVYAAIQDGMALVNGMIVAGLLTSTADLRAIPTGSPQGSSGGVGVLNHGKNEITCSWVNCTLRLNAYWTNKLIALLAAGSAAAAIAALLATAGVITSPGAIPSGLASAILALGAAGVSFCSNSHGVWIRWGLGSWCGGQ